ncbi:MAG TPA: hypothetical protein VMT55_03105 [Candidatus Sulfotelmatobacter sp.]|nr:hypothetical protein [Candidatus Sulfotelmatobacter sp.]
MKKALIVSAIIGFCASSVFAMTFTTGVGAKYGAMAGAGAAIVDDITCAYYNPAGITDTGRMELKIAAGAATQGLNDIINALGSSNDPAKFLADNFNKTVNISGGFNSFIGINVAKIGLSVIPTANLYLNKPTAGTLNGTTMQASGGYEGLVTLGYSFKTPFVNIASLNVGANIKSTNYAIGGSTVTGATSSTDITATESGTAFDVGVKAKINTPVIPFSAGIVIRDINATLKGNSQTNTTTYNPITGAATTVTGSQTAAPDSTIGQTTVIGAATVIPVYNLKVAVDLDNIADSSYIGTTVKGGNLTRIGLEYPVLGGILALRAGQVSGNVANSDVSQTTYGLGFQFGAVINVAMMTDNKNSNNNSTMVDCGFAF